MDVRFYHLTRDSVEVALPRLLEKVVERGHRVLVQLSGAEQLDSMDNALWTFRADSFLPHDRAGAKHPDMQLILLTCAPENENNADILVLVNQPQSPLVSKVGMVLLVFDGHNDELVASCRNEWRSLKADGAELTYWQQTDAGGWAQKA